MTRASAYLLLVLVQAACAGVFLMDILASIFGFYPVPLAWTTRELMEMGAGIGLVLGVVFGSILVFRAFKELHLANARLSRASSAFMDMLTQRFDEWGLTAAERDVAMFAIKGLNVQEIAALRATSEGTVKAQTAAIYRKANVTGRPQLLSLFIDDMMGNSRVEPTAEAPVSVARLRA
jgi:DNA-binding CsgD family transcriptional regulator